MAGALLFGSVSILVVNGATVNYGPRAALDAHGFGGSLRAQLPRHRLGMIEQDRQVNFEISRLLANGRRVVRCIGIDQPENDALWSKFVPQFFTPGNAFLHDGAT